MSARTWEFRIQDILEALTRIESYVRSITYEQWVNDDKTVDAVIRNLEIIGEASNHIPQAIQNAYSDIPWEQMRGMRNLLIHEYFGVDIEIIWKTVVNDLPGLRKQLENVDRNESDNA
ncbi:MAG: DUF86 domain-containing protein [Desulfuromonas sp.]|nr:DUF86 domain-containing protein [Desulfuromonas sp.]